MYILSCRPLSQDLLAVLKKSNFLSVFRNYFLALIKSIGYTTLVCTPLNGSVPCTLTVPKTKPGTRII